MRSHPFSAPVTMHVRLTQLCVRRVVAVNYAMSRTFPPEPSYHLIYDLGSGSLRVTLVSLRSAMLPDPLSLAETPQLKNVTAIEVHGFGYDLEVGGYVFDRAVRDLLVEAFEQTTGKQLEQGRKVTDDKRAMAKLLREAARVKQVLSANTAASARVRPRSLRAVQSRTDSRFGPQIEGLIDDLDFRTEITREALESRAASLVSHLVDPIQAALDSASVPLSSVESVILVGGSSRVPLVQKAVADKVGEDKIAKNVNADEAAVLGAALYGAGITRGFRTKDIRVQDLTPFGIDVAHEAERKEGGSRLPLAHSSCWEVLIRLTCRRIDRRRRSHHHDRPLSAQLEDLVEEDAEPPQDDRLLARLFVPRFVRPVCSVRPPLLDPPEGHLVRDGQPDGGPTRERDRARQRRAGRERAGARREGRVGLARGE